jgi:hypothetical protein
MTIVRVVSAVKVGGVFSRKRRVAAEEGILGVVGFAQWEAGLILGWALVTDGLGRLLGTDDDGEGEDGKESDERAHGVCFFFFWSKE